MVYFMYHRVKNLTLATSVARNSPSISTSRRTLGSILGRSHFRALTQAATNASTKSQTCTRTNRRTIWRISKTRLQLASTWELWAVCQRTILPNNSPNRAVSRLTRANSRVLLKESWIVVQLLALALCAVSITT